MNKEMLDFSTITDLGRKARNLKDWEWMQGMRVMNGRSGPRGTY
jgi:hypothetical protein